MKRLLRHARAPIAASAAFAMALSVAPAAAAFVVPQGEGTISGTVTSDTGSPLEAVCVDAWLQSADDGGYYSASAETGADGAYTITGLAEGSYQVEFSDCGNRMPGYVTEGHGDTSDWYDSEPLFVASAENLTGVDATLSLGGAISGTVTGKQVDAVTGETANGALEGLCVSTMPLPGSEGQDRRYGYAQTDADGAYVLDGLSDGPVQLVVEDCRTETDKPEYATTWFRALPDGGNSAPAQAEADAVFVEIGYVTELPEIRVADAGAISGAVVNQETAEPVEEVCVTAYSPHSTQMSGEHFADTWRSTTAVTDVSGVYNLEGLAPGQWAVQVASCDGGPSIETTWLHGKPGFNTADLITVTEGQVTQLFGTGLQGSEGAVTVTGGAITGLVTDPDGTPVAYACMNAIPFGSDARYYDRYVATTAEDGSYLLEGLPEGSYALRLDNCANHYYGQEAPNFVAVDLADTVSITSAGETRTIDASFEQAGGVISGTVVEQESGRPLPDVFVDNMKITTDPGSYESPGAFTMTGDDGSFRVVGLPAGTYHLSFYPSPDSYALAEGELPTDFEVTDGSEGLSITAAGEVALATGGRFEVRVTDQAGAPLTGLQLSLLPQAGGSELDVDFSHWPGDYHGYYRPATVPAGEYALSFNQCNWINEEDPCPTVGTYADSAGNQTMSVAKNSTTNLDGFALSVVRTHTTLTSSKNPAEPGELVTLTAKVTDVSGSGSPTGTVDFFNNTDGGWLGSSGISDGVATIETSEISPGNHELAARYTGDATYANSVGYLAQTVRGADSKLSTSTVLVTDGTPVDGVPSTYTATVTPQSGDTVPTGSVQLFVDGDAASDPELLVEGSAQIDLALPSGLHQVVARYSGDGEHSSSSASLLQQVESSTASSESVAALSASSDASTVGEHVTFTATVTAARDGGIPTGSVTFMDGDEPLATRTLDAAGSATFATSTLGKGVHSVTFVYSGDETFLGSVSSVVEHTVAAETTPPPTGGGDTGGDTGGSTPPPTGGDTPAPSDGSTTEVPAGGTASSDPGVTEPTPDNPVIATVKSPTGGTVSFDKIEGLPSPDGYSPIYAVAISAPAASVEEPLELTFRLDSSNLPPTVAPERVTMFRNGEPIEQCTAADGTATPDPCVSVQTFDGDDLTITVLSSHASEWVAGLAPVIRVSGQNRIGTAIATSLASFPVDGSAGAAVLARSDAYPDALVGGPLAAAKNAPLLLTASDHLSGATAEEMARVLAPDATVHLLGGVGALSADIAGQLRDMGYRVVRYGGTDRYATAVAVATRGLSSPSTIIEATGLNFADALSAGPAASVSGAAILLTRGDKQASATAGYLELHGEVTRYAVGGPATKADPEASPISGANRYATAVAVAEKFFPEPGQLALASGGDFPDALSGGAAASLAGSPMVLVPASGNLDSVLRDYLSSVASTVTTGVLYGGTAAVDGDVSEQLVEALVD